MHRYVPNKEERANTIVLYQNYKKYMRIRKG